MPDDLTSRTAMLAQCRSEVTQARECIASAQRTRFNESKIGEMCSALSRIAATVGRLVKIEEDRNV